MKILFTGGGSGGHFYPIIAVAEEVNRVIKEEKLLSAQLFLCLILRTTARRFLKII